MIGICSYNFHVFTYDSVCGSLWLVVVAGEADKIDYMCARWQVLHVVG